MKASIIILNWNGGADNCLEAVFSALEQDYFDKEIVFVDNGSTDNSFQSVIKAYPDLRFIQTGSNLGCPGGRNVGAQEAKGDILFFLENDGVWGSTKVVSSAMQLFETHADLGAIYTRVEGYKTGVTDPPVDSSTDSSIVKGLFLSSSFRGGAAIIRRDLFLSLGQYPSDFVRQYEERYLSVLIYDRGFKVAYWPEHVLRHKGSDYPGKSTSVLRYNCTNELKTIRRIYPQYLWVPYFIIKAILWAFRLLKQNKIGLFKDSIKQGFSLSKITKTYRVSLKTLITINKIRYRKKPIQLSNS